jgi:outer membrane protein assembly factor BamB
VVVSWIVVAGVLVVLFNGVVLPWHWVLAGFLPATMGVLWLSWMFFREWSWGIRLGGLVLSALLLAGSVSALRVNGLTGDARVDFAWRRSGPTLTTWSQSEPASLPAGSVALVATAEDFPQFLGPQRLGVTDGKHLARDWSRTPPREVWRRPIGGGWSSFAIVGDLAWTQEQRDADECVVCYRVADGSQQWIHRDPIHYTTSLGGPGPRATPTVSGTRVFAVGATGQLNCLDAATGKLHWAVNILEDNQAENIGHGVCGSPLILDDKVLVCPTGANGLSLVAYDATTGKRAWQGGKDRASYGSPALVELAGTRQVLLFTSQGMTGHDAATGKVLWAFPWTNSTEVNCSQPVPVPGGDGEFLIATGYDKGSARIKVERSPEGVWSARAVWENRKPVMQAKFTTPVCHGGCCYGLDNGFLACLDPATGKRLWRDGRYGHGQVLLAGDLLIVQAEDGRVILVEPSPDGLKELARIPALDGKTWNNPALAGRMLVVRNDREAVCYELPGAEASR